MKPVPLWLYNAPALFSHQQQTYALLWALENLSIAQLASYYPFVAAYRAVLDRGNQMLIDKMALKLQRAGLPPVGAISWAQSLGAAPAPQDGSKETTQAEIDKWLAEDAKKKFDIAAAADEIGDTGRPLWQEQGYASREAFIQGKLPEWKNAPASSWAIPLAFAGGIGLLLLAINKR